MKRTLISGVVALATLLAACTSNSNVTVTVKNNAEANFTNKTVELAWDSLSAKINGLTPENVVVTDLAGAQIPSQTIFNGTETPQSLIFQVSVAASDSIELTIAKGTPESYTIQTYGRYVPERFDDYAWENNLVGYRFYGTALRDQLVSSGVDFWSKSTSEMVIEPWYKKDISGEGSYHLDTGEGCDCYKVASTLGMGASAPVANDTLCHPYNYIASKALDCGPVRTSFELTFAPINVDGNEVNLVKTVTLDANTYFNQMSDLYTSATLDSITVAAGIIIHDDAQVVALSDFSALYEPASDSHAGGGKDGFIGGAVFMDGSVPATIAETAVRVKKIATGEPSVYYAGGSTSKRDMTDASIWFGHSAQMATELMNPLEVIVK